jgi:hypothetical protein
MKLEGLLRCLYDWTRTFSPNIFCSQFGYLESNPLTAVPSTTFLLEHGASSKVVIPSPRPQTAISYLKQWMPNMETDVIQILQEKENI